MEPSDHDSGHDSDHDYRPMVHLMRETRFARALMIAPKHSKSLRWLLRIIQHKDTEVSHQPIGLFIESADSGRSIGTPFARTRASIAPPFESGWTRPNGMLDALRQMSWYFFVLRINGLMRRSPFSSGTSSMAMAKYGVSRVLLRFEWPGHAGIGATSPEPSFTPGETRHENEREREGEGEIPRGLKVGDHNMRPGKHIDTDDVTRHGRMHAGCRLYMTMPLAERDITQVGVLVSWKT